jgi:hypothetical protein
MSVKGSISVSTAVIEVVPADKHREKVTLQHLSGDNIYLGFDEDAVVEEGEFLTTLTIPLIIDGYRAPNAIFAICKTAEAGVLTFQGV